MDRIKVMELVRSFQVGEIDRRLFMKRASTALGSAVAANALLVACGKSDSDDVPEAVVEEGRNSLELDQNDSEPGLNTGIADYDGPDGQTLHGYYAMPVGGGQLPSVVVIQEWWGLNENIKEIARRFAREGYAAIAPDLYHGVVTTAPDEARRLVMELDADAAVGEIQSAITYLLNLHETQGSKVGLVGFCMGGGLVLRTALVEERTGVAIPFYGSPLDPSQAADVKAPVLGLYGALDQGIPVGRVKTMETALKEAGIETKVLIYESAGHGFFNDTSSAHNPEAAADAWRNTLEWLQHYL